MTHLPTDPIDPYEARLAGRVHDHADQALAPFDAVAIAHAAAVEHPRRRFGRLFGASTAVGRLGWIAAAGLLAAATIGYSLSAGGKLPAGPVAVATASPTAGPTDVPTLAPTAAASPAPTPVSTPLPTPIRACTPADLRGQVVSWQGAAGQRVASLILTNIDAGPCTFPTITKPQLVDGNFTVLIDGTKAGTAKTLTLQPGKSLTSMAQTGNYCGPSPVQFVTVAIVWESGRKMLAPVSDTDMTGLPPCNGAGSPAYIEMQAWVP
jgi:hypothetical protein